MENARPSRDDLVCATLLVAWIAVMMNIPAIATFLSKIIP